MLPGGLAGPGIWWGGGGGETWFSIQLSLLWRESCSLAVGGINSGLSRGREALQILQAGNDTQKLHHGMFLSGAF